MPEFEITADALRCYLDEMTPHVLVSDGRGAKIQHRASAGEYEVTRGAEILIATADAEVAATAYNRVRTP